MIRPLQNLPLFVLILPTLALAQQPPMWTLDEAYARAIHNHPTVLQAVARLESAQAQVAVARNPWLPTANFDANHQELSGNNPTRAGAQVNRDIVAQYGLNPYWQTSLQVKWTVWDFGKTFANMEAARDNAQAADLDVRAARTQLWQGIAQSWLAVMAADAALKVLQAAQEQLARQRDAVKTQVSVRARPEIDLLKAEADVAAAEGDVLRAEDLARSQRLALGVAVGEAQVPNLPLPAPIFDLQVAQDAALDDEKKLGELLTLAVQNRPEFAALRARIAALQAAALAADRAMRPSFYVTGQTSLQGLELSALAFNYGVIFGVSMPISTFWTQPPQVADAEAQVRALAANQDAQVLTLRGQINQALSTLVQARKRVPVARTQAAYAERARDAANLRYKAGAGLWLEVADAQTGVVKAQLAVIQAELDVQVGAAQLAYAIGRVKL